MRLLRYRDQRSTHAVLDEGWDSVRGWSFRPLWETYPYPKSQRSPLEFDVAVSDIFRRTVLA